MDRPRQKRSEWRYGKRSGMVFGAFSGFVGGLAGCALSVGGYKLFILVLASSFIAAHIVDRYIKASIRKRGEVELDEMIVRVAWMSGYKAFKVSSIAIALILVALLALEYLNVRVPPYDLAEKLHLGLFTSLCILVLTYVAFSIYYFSSKKVIE